MEAAPRLGCGFSVCRKPVARERLSLLVEEAQNKWHAEMNIDVIAIYQHFLKEKPSFNRSAVQTPIPAGLT